MTQYIEQNRIGNTTKPQQQQKSRQSSTSHQTRPGYNQIKIIANINQPKKLILTSEGEQTSE